MYAVSLLLGIHYNSESTEIENSIDASSREIIKAQGDIYFLKNFAFQCSFFTGGSLQGISKTQSKEDIFSFFFS